jgi:ubiquitin-conjugating enzyme E2 S
MKLVLGQDYPQSPPRGFFLTKIYHPNVSNNGDICVNTLKKDWNDSVTLSHILAVIRCLLIVPFPESSLNDEAGKVRSCRARVKDLALALFCFSGST